MERAEIISKNNCCQEELERNRYLDNQAFLAITISHLLLRGRRLTGNQKLDDNGASGITAAIVTEGCI